MSMLHQILAVEDTRKKAAADALKEAYHKAQKKELFSGLSRTYSAKDEDGERLPSEIQHLQLRVGDLINEIEEPVKRYLTVIRTRDDANAKAKASVSFGNSVLADVPVGHLLFLEKQLTDLITFIHSWPTLDPTEEWDADANVNGFSSKPKETVRTKKIPKAFVKYEATDKHPAQVEMFTEDVVVGYWKAVKFSGAVSIQTKNSVLAKAQEVKDAIVKARQEANTFVIKDNRDDELILNYIFGD